jgi:hypothetical protein
MLPLVAFAEVAWPPVDKSSGVNNSEPSTAPVKTVPATKTPEEEAFRKLRTKTEWVSLRLAAGTHGFNGSIQLFNLRWPWFFWEALDFGGMTYENWIGFFAGTSAGIPVNPLDNDNTDHRIRWYPMAFIGLRI